MVTTWRNTTCSRFDPSPPRSFISDSRLTEGNEKNENDVIFLARNLFPIRYDGACTMVEERFFFFLLPEKRVYPWPTTASSTRFSGKGRDSLSSFS